MKTDDIIIVKLITGEEIIGVLKKKYTDGGIIIDKTKIVLTSEFGCYMERFIPFCENDDYEIGPHAIMTIGRPLKALVDFYHNGDQAGSIDVSSISLSTQTKH